jgi:hypothetical protein
MDHKQLRKEHPELFKLWVDYGLKYGGNPVPQEGKNYIISIVNSLPRCFTIIEYNDGWVADSKDGKVQDIHIPSREIISYQGQKIAETQFISLLIDIIEIYSTDELSNQLIICCKTNGAGQIVFDALRKELINVLSHENVKFFPTSRRSKYGKELFTKPGLGWEISSSEEKDYLDSMKTALEQGYFTLATDRSKAMFELTSVDYTEQKEIEPFMYCWMMLSFIRLSTMNLFME